MTLITATLKAMTVTPGIGRAEALRQAMTALIAKGGDDARPQIWAPFVLAGEGGSGR